MEIKATEVKRLREKTGAGMMDCKNALVKTDGDFDKAERLLKEQGLAAAVKKSDRVTNSGKIFSRILPTKGILLELTCETDFVARNSLFLELGEALLAKVVGQNLTAPDRRAPPHGQGDHRQDQGEHAAAPHRDDARRGQ